MELIWQISIHSRWEVGDNFANLVVIIGKSGKETAIFELLSILVENVWRRHQQ